MNQKKKGRQRGGKKRDLKKLSPYDTAHWKTGKNTKRGSVGAKKRVEVACWRVERKEINT